MAIISLRDVPDQLYQQLEEMAERERRSVNQQILVLLEQSVQLHQRPTAEVWQRIDRRREAVRARVGVTPNEGNCELKFLADRWTVVTKDKKLSAQFEHTVAVTEEGVEILTLS